MHTVVMFRLEIVRWLNLGRTLPNFISAPSVDINHVTELSWSHI